MCCDSMAEWLRRVIRNHMGYARVGSNPTAVARMNGAAIYRPRTLCLIIYILYCIVYT